ncbi:unnamed protein product [Paramecium pentaurelia]|uniref:Protein kinase domain-containing protein n=1 Tax=Paramecium pentaurelia TaxID=43138 RepID=A0A8S1S2I4_9CILI|nr:unnamed protein product [Paramecium pentaurelia]
MGKGGYSKVYKLCPLNKQSFQQQYYAGKVYNKNELAQKKNLNCLAQLVKAECEILKQVNSPFILTLYEIIQLDEQLKRKQGFKRVRLVALFLELHQDFRPFIGYVHRDIKLENILIDKDQIKIIDFGFAEQINREVLTSGQGTVGYMAPEIFTHKPYTELGDVFSLGVVYYLLLTGKPPFKGLNQDNIIRANQKCDIDFSEYCFVNVSQKTIHLVKGMLQKNPKQRSSLNEVLQNLKSQNLFLDIVYRSISIEGSQLTKHGGMRSLYLQSQCSQDSPRIQQKQSKLLNITQTLEKFAVKTSSFRPSLQNIDNYTFDSDDLEDNTLPQFVLENPICLNCQTWQTKNKYSKALYSRYQSNNSNFQLRSSTIIKFQDQVCYEENEDFYTLQNSKKKHKQLLEYYRYHTDIPRFFIKKITSLLETHHEKKREIKYNKIKFQLGMLVIQPEEDQHFSFKALQGLTELQTSRQLQQLLKLIQSNKYDTKNIAAIIKEQKQQMAQLNKKEQLKKILNIEIQQTITTKRPTNHTQPTLLTQPTQYTSFTQHTQHTQPSQHNLGSPKSHKNKMIGTEIYGNVVKKEFYKRWSDVLSHRQLEFHKNKMKSSLLKKKISLK